MARKGRGLELLIEKIENSHLPEGAKISSPGFITDKVTKQRREVDILIEHSIGTTDIKIVLECRDRSSIQDTTWIEQLHTKLSDLNIHKVIAVSSSPFSEPAKLKALHHNIETRTISNITLEDISSWWGVEYISTYTQQYAFVAAEVKLEFPELFEYALLNSGIDDKIFISTKDDKAYSISEIIPSRESGIFARCEINAPPIQIPLHVNYTNPEDRFYVKVHDKKSHVLEIVFHLIVSVTAKQVPISKIVKYDSDEKTVSHVIQYDNVNIKGNKTLQFIRNADGSISLSMAQ